MADGTIVPRSNHDVCLGVKSGGKKLILVPVGSPEAFIFEDILRGAGAPRMVQQPPGVVPMAQPVLTQPSAPVAQLAPVVQLAPPAYGI